MRYAPKLLKDHFVVVPIGSIIMFRHCLNVMHIKKKVHMNIVDTPLDIPGKTMDSFECWT